MNKRGNIVRITALSAALLGVYGTAYAATGDVTCSSHCTLDGSQTYTSVTVATGGAATGEGVKIEGSEYELAKVEPGGSLTLTDATITNTLGDTNGRAVSVDGTGGEASLTDSTIVLTTNNGTYAHAFTAGVGVADGGHADISGGTITATGSKRTVGIQANDGGSIDAKNVVVTTDSTFGHAVNAHTTGDGLATVVTLDGVTIQTNGLTYADGIQSANKGAGVVATDTSITTLGTNSFGAEVFNGATVSLTDGSIATSGANASGVRVYAGDGNTLLGQATVDGTTITTSGKNAIGVMAGDLDGDPGTGTAGIVDLSDATINTSGTGATGIQANYGGTITSSGSIITTSGSGAHAAAALNGSSITLDGDTLKATGSGYGLYVAGADSNVTATNGTTIETDNGKYAVEAADGGQVNLSGGSVTNAGTVGDRTGIYATGAGTSVTTHDVAIGNSAPGLGTGDLSNVVSAANNAMVDLNGGTVTSEGSTFGRGLLASSGAIITANDVDISTAGTLSNAVHAYSADEGAAGHDAEDSAFVTLDGGSVGTTGDNSYGLSAQNNGAVITATDTTGNTSIATSGANAFGASAYNGGKLDLTGVTVHTSGTGSDGIAVNESLGAQAPKRVPTPNVGSSLMLADSTITADKANGVYVGKDSTANISESDISASRHGLVIEDGAQVTMTDGSVASTGNEQHAVVVDGSGSSLNATGVAISAAGSVNNRGDVTHAVDVTSGGAATITGGTIKTTGANFTTGIFAASTGKTTTANATVTANNVAIFTTGDTGVGVRAYGEYENQGAVDTAGVTPDQTITINGGSITTTGVESYGIWSQDMGSHVVAGTYTNPDDASANPLTITTSGKDAYGVAVFGGADAKLTGTEIETSGEGASGVSLNAVGSLYRPTHKPTVGATFTMSDGSINTSGDSADGLDAALGSTATLTDTDISVTGTKARGVFVTTGSSVTLNGGSVSSIGNDWGIGLYSNGTGSTLTANDVGVTVQRTRVSSPNTPLGVGYEAKGGGLIKLTDGSVTTKNDWNDGLLAYRGTITADGTVIQTDGTASTGVKAWRETSGYAGATASVTLNGGTVTTLGNESYGLLAQNDGSSVKASDLSVTTQGSQSFGVDAYNGGDVTLNNVNVTTNGDQAHGLVVGSMSDTMRPGSDGKIPTVPSTINMTDGSVVAKGTNASGAYLEDSGNLTLTGVNVQSTGASITSQLTQAGQTQNITIGNGSTLTQNNGTLLDVHRTTDGMDGVVNLTLADGSTSHGDIVDLDGLNQDSSLDTRDPTGTSGSLPHGTTNFIVGTGATWSGVVRGVNDTTVEDGGSSTTTDANLSGSVTTGTGTTSTYNGTTTIDGGVSTGSGSTMTFNGDTTIGDGSSTGSGNVSGTGSTLTFNGPTTINNTVSGNNSTLSFNGNTTTIGDPVTGGGISGSDGTHFVFSKTGTTTIHGNVTLDGGSTTHGGTVDNLITISGNADVSGGATLGGDLQISGALNLNGGTIGPGNSVGIISVGSITSLSGTYHAEVNSAGKSDLIKITGAGAVDLSATALQVAQENGNGGYLLDHDYTILDAAGGLKTNTAFKSTGLDSSFSGSLVKLDPVMYDDAGGIVMVSLSLDQSAVDSFAETATPNQNATLKGVKSVAGQNSAASAALASSNPGDALDQLSGEAYASTQSALLVSGGLIQQSVFNRLRDNLSAGMLPGAPVAQSSGTLPGKAMPQSAAYPLWAQVVGNWNKLDGNSNAASVDTSTGGFFLGGDTGLGNGWRAGGAFGYTYSDIDVDGRSSSANVDSYTAAVYGGKSWAAGSGHLKFMMGAGLTRNNVDSRRSVTVGGSQTLKGSYHADGAQIFTELGYAMPLSKTFEVEPYLGLAYQSLHAQGFDESGGDAALSVDGQTDNVTTTTLGVRGKKTFNFSGKQGTLSAGLGWRHAMGDIEPSSQMTFVQGGGTPFTVTGAPLAEDVAVVNLGAAVAVGKNTTMGLSYGGQFGGGNTSNNGTVYLKVRFN